MFDNPDDLPVYVVDRFIRCNFDSSTIRRLLHIIMFLSRTCSIYVVLYDRYCT